MFAGDSKATSRGGTTEGAPRNYAACGVGGWVNNNLLERCLNRTDELSHDQASMSMSGSMINLLTNYTAVGQIQYHTYLKTTGIYTKYKFEKHETTF